ncbi:Phosphotransferase enzyme family protein [Streptomyces sp. 1222.5]|uniref:phosphotransferase family protein n=1 Tax=unclassified Streptomyces TaxID=2593676 RepID=UPI000897492D|nr:MULTISPECIES: aminoglycoside phosphotransferase family protein [unclassified Streptomyces]PKW06631.1 phosphotransferase family enzyme [Streptomyces sp. 5112.2]SED08544.1 Phosphotransferase enzyme family protein [Streptomyces sp. 1222.5]
MSLLPALTAQAEAAAHRHTGAAACACGAPVTLADRPDATVVRHAGTVAKAHAPDTEPAELDLRLAVAARLPDVLLAPLTPAPVPLRDRLVTFWPYGAPVDPDDPDAAPWEAAATLLARLHGTDPLAPGAGGPSPGRPVGPGTALPPMRGPVKAARAVRRLRTALRGSPHEAAAHAAGAPVLRAWTGLPAWARAEVPMPGPAALCHGDLHLGQLVRHPAPDGPWRLIDVDDLGVGVPAWDLARPAAWYACGLLPPDEWTRFLTAYRRAGGPAVPPDGDPWAALDVPARALTVQTAALTITKALAADRPLDEVEQALVDACERMTSVPRQLTPGLSD